MMLAGCLKSWPNSTEFNNFIYDASHMLRLKMIVNQLQNYLIYFRDISINGG